MSSQQQVKWCQRFRRICHGHKIPSFTLFLYILSLPAARLTEAFVSTLSTPHVVEIISFWGGSGRTALVRSNKSSHSMTRSSSSASDTPEGKNSNDSHSDNDVSMQRRQQQSPRRRLIHSSGHASSLSNTTTSTPIAIDDQDCFPSQLNSPTSRELQLWKRVKQMEKLAKSQADYILEIKAQLKALEKLVVSQANGISEINKEIKSMKTSIAAFANVVEVLRAAGLDVAFDKFLDSQAADLEEDEDDNDDEDDDDEAITTVSQLPSGKFHEDDDDTVLFGKVPASVLEAADIAGSSILAAVLAGKQRLLVDVRDAELSDDPETLVQFLELAVLPIAAGLEGLQDCTRRSRLKIVFPTLGHLMDYRQRMAISAPEVVALSTLGFDPIEAHDHLVVVIAPSPDDTQGVAAMKELFEPRSDLDNEETSNATCFKHMDQPIVVLNYHAQPDLGQASNFEVAYHLRILKVQYLQSSVLPAETVPELPMPSTTNSPIHQKHDKLDDTDDEEGDEALAAAMEWVKSSNSTSLPAAKAAANVSPLAFSYDPSSSKVTTTRAVVIRAYPNPWHVFVDTSSIPLNFADSLDLKSCRGNKKKQRDALPIALSASSTAGTNASSNFEVAAIFTSEPTQQQVYAALVECLEGSEHEDEIVAQQMQQALENGQLDRVDEILEQMGIDLSNEHSNDDGNYDELNDDFWNLFDEDSV